MRPKKALCMRQQMQCVILSTDLLAIATVIWQTFFARRVQIFMSFGQHFAKSVFPTIHRNQVISKPQNARPSEWGLKHKLRVNYKYVQVNAMDSVHKIPRVSSGRKRVDMVLIWKENFPGSSPRPNPLIYAPVCMDRHFGQMSMNEWKEWVKYAQRMHISDPIRAKQLTLPIRNVASITYTPVDKHEPIPVRLTRDVEGRFTLYGFQLKHPIDVAKPVFVKEVSLDRNGIPRFAFEQFRREQYIRTHGKDSARIIDMDNMKMSRIMEQMKPNK
jgi:hypothetical protein